MTQSLLTAMDISLLTSVQPRMKMQHYSRSLVGSQSKILPGAMQYSLQLGLYFLVDIEIIYSVDTNPAVWEGTPMMCLYSYD